MRTMGERFEAKEQQQDDHRSISNPLPREPYTWLIIKGLRDDRQVSFYSITEDRYYIRSFPELQNMHVSCCYDGWLVLSNESTDDCFILNILTMEKFQLPKFHDSHPSCVLSSSKMDTSCRIVFLEHDGKFSSCNLGDTEFIEGQLTYGHIGDGHISKPINFNGKLYALIFPSFNLIASDFSDPDLRPQQVVNGESVADMFQFFYCQFNHLVESCGELLLIAQSSCDGEVNDVKIFRADFSARIWVKLETLGDRALFLGSHYSISSPASAHAFKGNAVYWTHHRHLFMYDVEDESITMKLPCPIACTYSSLLWVSLPVTCCNNERQQSTTNSLFEASPVGTELHAQCQPKSMELQVEQRKNQKKEETETICSKIVTQESLWADFVPKELLLDIFSRLFAGDMIMFRSVCKSWYSVSSSVTTHLLRVPHKSPDCHSPFLVCSDYKIRNPIYGELHSNTNIWDIPEGKVRASQYGWLLIQDRSNGLFFYNPLTKEERRLPYCDAVSYYYSLHFSAPPTSEDCLVVAGVSTWDDEYYICSARCKDEGWCIVRKITKPKNCVIPFSFCNAVIYKGLYYFLMTNAMLLIYDSNKGKVCFKEAPISVTRVIKDQHGHEYLFESDDGKLIAVFVSRDGSSVYVCQWNVSNMTWTVLESLGNKMLFISRPVSFCQRATVSGTGNKIYFPRVVGDDNILFYSLGTKRYHTFEMGSSYRNFSGSKFYIKYKGCWFLP